MTPPPFDWSTVLLAYGPLGVIAVTVFYFVYTYGPRIIEGHVSFMTLCRETHAQQQDYNRRLTVSLESLNEAVTVANSKHDKTHRMIGHVAEAGKMVTNCQEAQRHLDRAIDERER